MVAITGLSSVFITVAKMAAQLPQRCITVFNFRQSFDLVFIRLSGSSCHGDGTLFLYQPGRLDHTGGPNRGRTCDKGGKFVFLDCSR